MKQSGVLLHSKVKKSPLQSFVDNSFLSHSLVVHNLDKDQESKSVSQCIHGASRGVGSSLRGGWSAPVIEVTSALFFKTMGENNGVTFLWDKAFSYICAYTVKRETTKFPDM